MKRAQTDLKKTEQALPFSWQRLMAILLKEFTQIRRDKLTIALLVMIPLMQLILFGYAINGNPRHLPTAVISADPSPLTRTLITAIEASSYFTIINDNATEAQAHELLTRGEVTFIINIPANFTHDLIRKEKPSLLITADATDPSTSGYALSTLHSLLLNALNLDFQRGLRYLLPADAPFNTIVHAAYNPANKTEYNIVPGLMGVVLTMTMVMITCMAITRERERGTMESLLATPVQPLEVMLGKILPYILIGYIQEGLILMFAHLLFDVPSQGSIFLLFIATLPFIAANLTIGLAFSTIAKNQLQAMEMTFFYFLPCILLSGFMFPFYGMPQWAQWIGEVLPLTHFLIIIRGIMLKGNGLIEIWPQVWPMLLFTLVLLAIGFKRYRRTLD